MTTSAIAPAKPRRRRAKRKPATVTIMNQQPPSSSPTRDESLSTTRTFPDTMTVQSHLPDVTVLNREAYWSDFKNRMAIHNYEVGEAMKELKTATDWMNVNGRKVVDRIKSVEIQ